MSEEMSMEDDAVPSTSASALRNDRNDENGADGHVSDSSGESFELTPAELANRFMIAWQNEKLTPDLLVPIKDEADCMYDQIKVMEANLATLRRGEDMLTPVHTMELNRIRYLLASYLRTRLFKIQEYCWHIKYVEDERRKKLQQKAITGRRVPPSVLMPKEYKFLLEYLNIVEGHMTNVAVLHMPASNQPLDKSKLRHGPNMDSFVFFRCLKTGNIYKPNEDVDIDLEEDALYMMRYGLMARKLYFDEVLLF